MVRRFNFSKIFVTVVLTVLIWVWADLALDEEFAFSNAKIAVAKSVNPALWVSFAPGKTMLTLDKIVIRGSARKISEARRRINDGSFIPEFYFDPEHEKITRPGDHVINVADFLKSTDKIKELGVTVDSAEPNTLTVSVVELQKKQLAVRCIDENMNPLKVASVEPATVEAFVPAERSGEALEAKVVLSSREIEQARLAAIEKMSYVELAAGQARETGTSIKVLLPKEQQRLQEYLVTSVRLGFSLSANLQGKIRVDLINPDTVMGTVAIRATPEAKRAYDNMRYHVILEIDDSDKDSRESEIRRDLVYNLPQEFVRKEEIVLSQAPVQARFKLISLASPLTDSAAVPEN